MNKINKSISVVVPVYNSEKTLDKLIKRLKQVLLPFYKYSIILVNDNSKDNSFNIIKSHAQQDKNIVAINLTKNVGQQKSTFLGLKYVKNDYIIIIDDDFANDPDDIMLLYEEMQKGYDVVYGINRNIPSKPLYRNFGSKVRNITFNIITDKPKEIKVSSFRIIRKEINEKIIKANTNFIYISMEILKHTTNIGNIFVDYKNDSPTNYRLKKLASLIVNMYIYYSNQKIFEIKPMAEDTYKISDIINGDTT